MRLAILAPVLVFSSLASASDAGDFLWKRNADAIVAAVKSGADLSKSGLADLLFEDELAVLSGLKDCPTTSFQEVTKNFAATDFICDQSKLTVQMRFRDDGSLFALSINPMKANFAPTSIGIERREWPSREASARAFAKAVSQGGDLSLGGIVPVTKLQATQFARLADSRWEIQKYMTEAEKREARKILGPETKFGQRPEDGVEIVFASKRPDGPKDKFVTLYFDKDDRAIGVHVEDSLLTVAAMPVRN